MKAVSQHVDPEVISAKVQNDKGNTKQMAPRTGIPMSCSLGPKQDPHAFTQDHLLHSIPEALGLLGKTAVRLHEYQGARATFRFPREPKAQAYPKTLNSVDHPRNLPSCFQHSFAGDVGNSKESRSPWAAL